MTDSNPDNDNRYRIDRRTVLKLAGWTGGGVAFSGSALAGTRGSGAASTGDGRASPGFERIHPERPPPWVEVNPTPEGPARDRWFVEFAAPPTARGGRSTEHAAERSSLRAQARQAGVTFTEQRDFTTLWNGLSVRAGPADVTALRGLESVSAVYPVALVERTEAASPQLDTALEMTGADHAQDIGLSGEGLSIAIVDTGVDYNHPDLGGGGDPDVVYTAASEADRTLTGPDGEGHPRISHGWDYVGSEFDASDPESQPPEPDPDPMDGHGHGTHVSGIAGADAADEEGVTGVAPGATLGAYKVFAEGSTTADVIVEALEDAFEDGMDVVNMSLGATLTWGQVYPTTAASNELANQGVVVVNSAGNDAAFGTWSMSAPANAHDIISVASADNTFLDARVFGVDELAEPVPYLELDGAALPPTEGESAPLALPNPSTIGGEQGYFGCEPEDFADFPEGHVALIERGHCFFADKYANAVEAGATGVVIFNNVQGLFAGTILETGVEGVWGAGISDTSGAALADLVEAGQEVTLAFTDQQISVPNPTGGLLSSFSSYGQDVELGFGPSLTAPGGLITSSWPLEQGAYAMLSGTSMAAPHVAGAVALLLEDEPDLDPFDVRDRLQNTAEPSEWSLAPGFGFVDHAFRQGAGMLQVDRSVGAAQRVTPGHVAAGEAATTEATLTVWNDGDEAVEYAVGHVGTIDAAVTTFAPLFFLSGGAIDAPATVTVPANGSTDVDVTIDAPGFGLPNYQYGGYVVLTPDDESRDTLRVPYSGYDGDYQSLGLFGYYAWPDDEPLPVFVEQEPTLSKIVYDEEGDIDDFEPVESGHTFTLRDDDLPVVEAFFGHFPQEMKTYAVNQASGEEWLVMEDRFLPRSPDAVSAYPFAWAGTTQAGRSGNRRPVESGTYTLRVEVLHTLGDADNPDHVETWESPAFELDTRPARGRESAPARSRAGSADRA